MTVIPFGELRQDVSDFRGTHTQTALNVVPHGDGYAPIGKHTLSYSALASACRGFFTAYKADGTKIMFAGTATKLYSATSSSWTDRSKGAGSYTTLNSGENWQFAQFNNFVFAVQANTTPQVYDLTSSSAFADLGGSPPNAKYITIVDRFVVLGGLASPNGNRIQWSGLNATTTWTSGVTLSDFQDLPDGGLVRGLSGGATTGYIFSDRAIRRMTFAPGSPFVFGIDVIARDEGLIAPYSLCQAGDKIFYYSQQGFKMLQPGQSSKPIGKEKVDRTVGSNITTTLINQMVGSPDPANTRVVFGLNFNSVGGIPIDTFYFYDWALDRWTTASVSAQWLHNGVHAGAVNSTGPAETFLVCNNSNIIGTMTGTFLEATVATAELEDDTRRMFAKGFRPLTDATSLFGKLQFRNYLSDTTASTTETSVNSIGEIEQRKAARLIRAICRIPASTSWTFISGVEVMPEEAAKEGKR
ncbi:MAG: hypothetical protein ACM3IH_14130 [Sphingobacteriales bacterium]